MLEELSELVPVSARPRSGSVFYSGRDAFEKPMTPMYILGLNPGGSPEAHEGETVERHAARVVHGKPNNWSEYRDESWEGAEPGCRGMQPRVSHLLSGLRLDPGRVPASNVVFVRSRGEADIAQQFAELAEETWSFHQRVIEGLGIRVLLCFGQRAGDWVAAQVGATRIIDRFVEDNRRQWTSLAMANNHGLVVIRATHPGRVKWQTPAADPTRLVKRILEST